MTTEITTTAGVTAVVIILTTILLVVAAKVFSRSPSRDSNNGGVAPNIPDASSSSSSSPSYSTTCVSRKYDVFLSFRGEDMRKTFVDHLYSALQRHAIQTYKDDETLPRGDTIGPSLLRAIGESQIALIIFSENYADSSWCLDELLNIMKCKEDHGQIVIPIFYNVDPSDVRKQKGKFGKAFAKLHKLSKNKNKVESWKKALFDASNIAGMETKHIANGHETRCIQEIVDSILNRLSSLGSTVEDKELVGMGTRLEQLRSQLGVGSGGVRMVGIWGVGGGGKTTLAFSAYNKLRVHFHGHCFIENIREKSQQINGLEKLQESILSAVLKTQAPVTSVQEGRYNIQSMLCRQNVLIVLDDVDHPEQLKALAGSRGWFGDGSRILITTRDQHLLKIHRVDEVSPVSLLSYGEAVRLFRMHAYNENEPVEDYKMLSKQIVSYAAGLPLALVVLGSFLCDKDKDEWLDTLDRLKDHPEMDIMKKLKISYDGLKHVEKELFLDIACFHIGRREDYAMEMLHACGLNPDIGVKVLKQKALVTVSKYGKFDMHDLVQEMAHYIVRGEKHPSNPEEHSRVWRYKDIQDLCQRRSAWPLRKDDAHKSRNGPKKDLCHMNATMENDKIEAIQCIAVGSSSNFNMLVSNLKKLRFLKVTAHFDTFSWLCIRSAMTITITGPSFLSNELRYIHWDGYTASTFPESFLPSKLVVLKLESSLQKELWTGYKCLPCLKELALFDAKNLVRTPDFDGLPCLQKLILRGCHSLEEIHQSLGYHSSLLHVSVRYCDKLTRFPTIVKMDKLQSLIISGGGFPMIEAKMDNLVECLPSFKELELYRMSKLVRTPDFGGLQYLQKLNLWECESLEEIHQSLGYHSSLLHVSVRDCNKLTRFPTIVKMDKLQSLEIYDCKALIEFPKIEANMDNLVSLRLYNVGIQVLPSSVGEYCTKLTLLKLEGCSKLKSIDGNFHALKCLKIFLLSGCKQFEKFPTDLFNENLDGFELFLDSSSIKQLIPSSVQRFLRKLTLGMCGWRDGDIPSKIGELSNLRELRLFANDYTPLDFSLSRLTCLKLLQLELCNNLVELPELPSSLAILRLYDCRSLEVIKDDAHRRCKSLCEVSISGERKNIEGQRKNITGGERLLESMLQGNAVESRCMILRLSGLEIPRGFEPRVVRGERCRMQLPENWYNHFSGFLICAVVLDFPWDITIRMKHEKLTGDWMRDSQDCVYWEETVNDKHENNDTYMIYISFGFLRNTSWWDQSSTAIELEIDSIDFLGYNRVIGCESKLIPKRSETSITDSSFDDVSDDYTCPLKIHHDDSKSLMIMRVDSTIQDLY